MYTWHAGISCSSCAASEQTVWRPNALTHVSNTGKRLSQVGHWTKIKRSSSKTEHRAVYNVYRPGLGCAELVSNRSQYPQTKQNFKSNGAVWRIAVAKDRGIAYVSQMGLAPVSPNRSKSNRSNDLWSLTTNRRSKRIATLTTCHSMRHRWNTTRIIR